MNILTAEQMRNIDRRAIEEHGIPSIVLMENAALRVAEAIDIHFPEARRIAIFCGTGQNGGDGFALARHLVSTGVVPRLFLIGSREKCRGDAALNLSMCETLGLTIDQLDSDGALSSAIAVAHDSDLVIDAIFGTGLARPAERIQAACIGALNSIATPVVAIDLPSGLNASTGGVDGVAVDADLTVTFVAPKFCHIFSPAAELCGEVVVADISIPDAAVQAEGVSLSLITPQQVDLLVPRRSADSHKGTWGHVAIIAGSVGKSGAAILAARGALHGGAGLVTVITDRRTARLVDTVSIESMTLAARVSKADLGTIETFIREKSSAVAIGPGLVDDETSWSAIRDLVSRIDKPLVIDASALNAFASRIDELNLERHPRVLTPHPGELGRLLGCTTAEIQTDRIAAAVEAAHRSQSVVVLKGHQTVVADPDGEVAINPTGNPGMATGGTGDVLTGLVATFLAQNLDPWDATRAAVYLHGSAGDLVAQDQGEVGIAASDLARRIPHAIRNLRT